MNIGQITKDCRLGQHIYKLSKSVEIKNIVEIGTWSGLGSTKCIIDGLLNRADNYKFVSVELYPDMYKIALKNLVTYLNKKIIILNGRIIEYEDVFWFDHKTIDFVKNGHADLYYRKDMEYLKNSINVMNDLPDDIDLLVLDGGEYTTYPEYKKLKSRTKIIVLDDTNTLKCKKIRSELLEEKCKIIVDVTDERNGYSIFDLKNKKR